MWSIRGPRSGARNQCRETRRSVSLFQARQSGRVASTSRRIMISARSLRQFFLLLTPGRAPNILLVMSIDIKRKTAYNRGPLKGVGDDNDRYENILQYEGDSGNLRGVTPNAPRLDCGGPD